jgi:hypothetical protein
VEGVRDSRFDNLSNEFGRKRGEHIERGGGGRECEVAEDNEESSVLLQMDPSSQTEALKATEASEES